MDTTIILLIVLLFVSFGFLFFIVYKIIKNIIESREIARLQQEKLADKKKKFEELKKEYSAKLDKEVELEIGKEQGTKVEKRQRSDNLCTYVIKNTKYFKTFNVCSPKLLWIKNANNQIVDYHDVSKGRIEDYKVFYLPDIMYWTVNGSLQYSSKVSGGGLNAEGAIKGAIYAGVTGAVIGAAAGSQIRTENVKNDSREIILVLKDGTQTKYSYYYYDTFVKLLPEKEYSYVTTKNALESNQGKPNSQELRNLKSLLDDGVITEKDFYAKKKQILGL